MKLYHGSHIEVKNPKILTSSRVGDFGRGFYTTSNLEQARRWAQIRAKQEEVSAGIVTAFEVPEHLWEHSELRIKSFETADEEWLDFVLSNRKDVDFDHEFDVVRGPVANDRVYVCLKMLEDGLTDRETVIRKLKTYVLADQILFHTAKSLLFLEYAATEEVSCK
ncbi:MAG: DUF3990 domain-containing protein [Lentisphaeria bacterium]|nr:DUF3990 domain-containing protein [Lentisphaeria bacterium]